MIRMEYLCSQEELISFYEQCNKIGLPFSINKPLVCLNIQDLEVKKQKNQKLTDTFRCCAEKNWVRGKYLFLLADVEGYLLEVKCSIEEEKYVKDSGFRPGVSFKEESCGTNAISMAMRLKRVVYIRAYEHYCDIFKKWYCIASHITTKNGEIVGYVDISIINEKIADEITIVIKLLAEKIANKYENRVKEEELKDFKIKLNDKQIKILTLEAKGYKELAIAELIFKDSGQILMSKLINKAVKNPVRRKSSSNIEATKYKDER